MTSTIPLVYTEPPETKPRRFGLFNAATPVDQTDPHALGLGIAFQSLASVPAELYPVNPAGVLVQNGTGGTKTLPQGLPQQQALPFAVYAGVECGSLGWSPTEVRDRALAILESAGQHAAELALWTGAAGNAPQLNAASSITVAGTTGGIVAQLGKLEKYLADHYNGEGLIHATPDVAALAASFRLVRPDPSNSLALRTPLGNRWVFHGGGNGTGPNAVVPAATSTWIYATGAVAISRGRPEVPADFGAALKRSINTVALIGEQNYLIAVDGPIAAALVTLAT